MKLVIHEFALIIRSFYRLELSAAHSIPGCYLGSFVIIDCCASANSDTRLHHYLIDDLWVGLHFEVSFLCDIHKARKKILARNSDLIERQEAIVNTVVSKFLAYIANFDSG